MTAAEPGNILLSVSFGLTAGWFSSYRCGPEVPLRIRVCRDALTVCRNLDRIDRHSTCLSVICDSVDTFFVYEPFGILGYRQVGDFLQRHQVQLNGCERSCPSPNLPAY